MRLNKIFDWLVGLSVGYEAVCAAEECDNTIVLVCKGVVEGRVRNEALLSLQNTFSNATQKRRAEN